MLSWECSCHIQKRAKMLKTIGARPLFWRRQTKSVPGCWERSFVGCPEGCFRGVPAGAEGSVGAAVWETWWSGSDFSCCLYDNCCSCEAVANPAASGAVLSPSHPWRNEERWGS